MSCRSTQDQKGLAALESAAVISVLFAVFLVVLGILDYLNRIDAVVSSLDREIRNARIPSLIVAQTAGVGSITLAPDTAALRDFVDTAVGRVSADRAEVAAALVDIVPATGALTGVRPPLHRKTAGQGRPINNEQCPGVESELVRFSGSSVSTPSAIAIPQHGSSVSDDARYLPQSVILVGRGEIDFRSIPLTGWVLELIGSNPRITVCTATLVRSDVSL